MKAATSAELFKLSRRRMTWILLGLVVVLVAAMTALLFLAAASGEGGDRADLQASLDFRNVVTFGDSTVFRAVALLAIILAGTTTSAEFHWRTVITLCIWGGNRRRLLAGRFAALGVCVAAGLVAGYVTLVGSSVAGNAARGTLVPGDVGLWVVGEALLAASRAWLLVMVYVVLAATIAILTRSTAAAVAIPLVVFLLEPFGAAAFHALGGPLDVAAEFTLTRNIDAVLAADGPVRGAEVEAGEYPSAIRGAAFLVTFSAITAWIAVRAFDRRDIEQ